MSEHERHASFIRIVLDLRRERALGQQGIASRNVKPQAAPPASGRPFNANFTDVAQPAGLRSLIIYGGIDCKKYILEANGCGCAFIDYDNDGGAGHLFAIWHACRGRPARSQQSAL